MKKTYVTVKAVIEANEVLMGKRQRPCTCHPAVPARPTRAQLTAAGEKAMRSLRQRGRL
jgi:hypothetical protein